MESNENENHFIKLKHPKDKTNSNAPNVILNDS